MCERSVVFQSGIVIACTGVENVDWSLDRCDWRLDMVDWSLGMFDRSLDMFDLMNVQSSIIASKDISATMEDNSKFSHIISEKL